ncbi:MAG: ABC transporter ATP-binding protein [Eubacteriaceae bacterium]|jgi:ABC-2 type transport system ATP-binding protein|uniref:ABC transporter ATP-binding protein n=1 Tax=Candidatus Pseudoramibacter fermentans TaxID=2594427 RepID=A0A6L5GT17_9FIRM|nr:ABC transporter ATP-binding protein [Candidatus Pseudoramibacter fermentans]RRF93027.1 MAG: ABC transporter ATP-binding protein [Eubacteriaceae bacterium]
MSEILKAEQLTKRYGGQCALDHIDLSLERGRIVGLLGPNGSGKTTLLKIAAGLLSQSEGSVTIDDEAPGKNTKRIVSYLPDRPVFSKSMRVNDLVCKLADFYDDFDREQALRLFSEMDIDLNKRFKELSKGTIDKVQIVLAMSRKAALYLLDEPIGGVDPAARELIIKTIINNYNPEATVVIATHLIADVEPVLDDVVFLKQGHIVLHQDVDGLRAEREKSVDEIFREVFSC